MMISPSASLSSERNINLSAGIKSFTVASVSYLYKLLFSIIVIYISPKYGLYFNSRDNVVVSLCPGNTL